MRSTFTLFALGAVLFATGLAEAELLVNGSLDATYLQEITPGFSLPKPANWVNEGFRSIAGPYEDEMSSEPWAGPAPTPVTPDDWAVFFKAFTGSPQNGTATGHLYQDVPATAGQSYTLTGWAGCEGNFSAEGAEFALEFYDGSRGLLGSAVLDLIGAGLYVNNDLAFDYKQYSVSAVAPAGTVLVRARASMIDGVNNPLGGGQAFVVDDFSLVPEPSSLLALTVLGAAGLIRRR